MTRSSNRRAAALLAGAAAAAGLVLAGCSAGQIAETARKNPSVNGANAEAQLRDEEGRIVGSVAVRDVVLAYGGQEGYASGDDAPLSMSIFNDTPEAVQVRVSIGRPASDAEQAVAADAVELVGGAEPTTSPSEPAPPVASPSDSPGAEGTPGAEESPGTEGSPGASPGAEPTAPAEPQGQPAVLEIAAGSFAVLGPDADRHLRLVGLSDDVRSGQAVPLIFMFSNGLELRVNAPVSVPLTPVPRGSPEIEDLEGGH